MWSSVILPIASKTTLEGIIKRLSIQGIDVVDKPLLRINPIHPRIEDVLSILRDYRGGIVSVFTSKNAVKILVDYLKYRSLEMTLNRLINRSICIGPSTSRFLKRYVGGLGIHVGELEIEYPRLNHNSLGLARLVEAEPSRPVLWSSINVSNILRRIIKDKGGIIGDIYRIIFDAESLGMILNHCGGRPVYVIFMSRISVDGFKDAYRGYPGEIYGIFISSRIYDPGIARILDESYVYRGTSIDGFHNYVMEILRGDTP